MSSPVKRSFSLKRRIIRRVLVTLPIPLLIIALQYTGTLDRLADRVSTTHMNWLDNFQIGEHIRNVIVEKGLTQSKRECLLLSFNGNDPSEATRVKIIEKNSPTCGGQPNTPLHFFTVKIDKLHKTLMTDQGNPGVFRPLE
ncbi:hypothetical protein [Entomobacter blattae]|uniref:Uncharacterized protein n=1 Tax=Entomobacter blattae TaxID=2762277 RepID=A0A7H1NNQ8_9PROT|nr:hypothetical protein [Entomobacter blattae]QNT77418.1 hypothetical protein JGUZn3_01530 [Entomobacter blattae]